MGTMNLSTWHGMRTRDPRRLVLGSAQWGMAYGVANRTGEPSDGELTAMLARAQAAGVRTIETARGYGRSEARIGSVLGRTAGSGLRPADGWRLATKLDPDTHREGLGVAETLERMQTSLAASRAALGMDALPVLMLHRFAHRHACGGRLWRALLAEREAGRIGSLGVCTATPEEAWAALEDPDIEVLQVASGLLDLRLHRQGFFPRARELGRTIYVHGVFLYGVAQLDPRLLAGALAPLAAPMHAIARCAERLGVAPRAVHLAFARELPGIHPVVGCETDAQLAELLADWTSERVDAAAITQLVDALPTLEAEVVDPTHWGGDPLGRGALVNQTTPTSVATIPG